MGAAQCSSTLATRDRHNTNAYTNADCHSNSGAYTYARWKWRMFSCVGRKPDLYGRE